MQKNLLEITKCRLKQRICNCEPENSLLAPTWWQPHIPLLIFQSGSEVGRLRAAVGNPWQQSSLPVMRRTHAWMWVHVEGTSFIGLCKWGSTPPGPLMQKTGEGAESSWSWVQTRVSKPSMKTPSDCIHHMVLRMQWTFVVKMVYGT